MAMPKVSVIIPNYRHAPYLPRRIESVLNQTFTDIEVICMDDASPDNSREVIARYSGDPRVRTVFNEVNSGSTFKQWNKGARLACGQYIWFAESDDFADPGLLERLVGVLDANPSCGLAFCQSHYVGEDDQATGMFTAQASGPEHWKSDFVLSGVEACRRYLFWENVIPNASAVVMRRDLYLQVGGADESMRLAGDWKLYAAVLSQSDLAFVAEPLNYFRRHANTVRSETHRERSLFEQYDVMGFMSRFVSVDRPRLRHRRWHLACAWAHLLDERRISRPMLPKIATAAQKADGLAVVRTAWALARRVAGRYRRRFRRSASA
jgi:glycosyltransferase involved in cell wall biosynthesis